jgi:hypothetical protein
LTRDCAYWRNRIGEGSLWGRSGYWNDRTANAVSSSFDNIQSFLEASRGQITIGEIPPIRSAALAAEGKKVRVALARRDELEKTSQTS